MIERRYVELGKALPAAEDLVRSGAEVIAVGATGAFAAKQATSTVPIVLTSMGDPVAVGLVDSLARPGGNVTGMSLFTTAVEGKRLELLKEAVIGLASVAVLAVNRMSAPHQARMKEIVAAARALRLQVEVVEARSRDEFADAFRTIAKRGFGAVFIAPAPLFNIEASSLVRLAAEHRLPVMHFVREAVQEGALMSYGASFPDVYRRAAGYVDKILRGAHPRDLPVEQASKFELVINLKTAKALGLTIPQSLLLRADEVIE